MASSVLKLVTGVVDGKSIRNSIDMQNHGFTAGQVLRWDIEQQGFTAAIATSLNVQVFPTCSNSIKSSPTPYA